MRRIQNQSNYALWLIDSRVIPAAVDERIRLACTYGLLAPSVHNIQPWRFEIRDRQVLLRVDLERQLKHGDPTGRQIWISLGCCLENILLATPALGLEVVSMTLQPDETTAAVINLQDKPAGDRSVLKYLIGRRSNRSLFSPKPVSVDELKKLAVNWQSDSVQIIATADKAALKLVADLTARGIAMALNLPDFKRELGHLLRPNWTKAHDGIPGFALNLGWLRSAFEPARIRYAPVAKTEAKTERQRLLASGGLVMVFTKGDTKQFWLEAGRAYERAAIMATELGLDQSTTAAAVEAPDFHKEIEAYFDTPYRLQTIMRIGYDGAEAAHSPRRSLDEV